MDELQRILKLAVKDRTEEDIAYLDSHKEELNEEQQTQLAAEACDIVVEEYEAKFVKKSVEKLELSQQIQKAKDEGKFKTLAFNIEVKDLGERMMEAVISSESIDRHGEKIDMRGMDIKEYMSKNPILADGHDYSKSSVGRTHKLTKKADGRLVAKFEWAKTERAKELYQLYKDGFQFAFSIGFMAEEMEGNIFTKATLLEFSPVLIPANPDAVLLSKKKGIDSLTKFNYNSLHMYKLEEILKKELNNLTLGEVAFLKENLSKLSDEDKTKFATVLSEKKVEEVATKSDTEEVSSKIKAALAPLQAEIDKIKAVDEVKVKELRSFEIIKNTIGSKSEKDQHALKFLYYVRGLQSGNFREYINLFGKSAMNTTDEGAVMPPAEFIAEVERLEENYGVARRFARMRRSTNGSGVQYTLGADDIEVFDTAEGGAKQSSKLGYTSNTLLWRKFAGITPITDELTEDAAFDLWTDASRRYARAFAMKEDYLVFRETSAVSPKNKGILEVSGTNRVEMSGTGSDDAFADVEYDDLVDMITGVPTASAANGRFYFHNDVLGVLMKMKDGENRPIWLPAVSGGAPATILGKPYEVTEIMPSNTESGQNVPFMAFGDLDYVTLGERTGMQVKIFDSGTVGDPDEEDQSSNQLNLVTQDMQAMRAVKRMNSVVRFPAAFSVLVTGNVNS